MEEGREKGERGNGRDGTGHGVGRGRERRKGRRGAITPKLQFLAPSLVRRIVTANMFSQGRGGRPGKIFPIILFDLHAKFACSLSYRVGLCKKSPKF